VDIPIPDIPSGVFEKQPDRRELDRLTREYLDRGGEITICPPKKPPRSGPKAKVKTKSLNTEGQRAANKTVINGIQNRLTETYPEFKRLHLSEEENKILWLKDRQGKSFKEIAIRMKQPAASLRKKAQRAREKDERGILFISDGRKKKKMCILRKKAE
jgi:hypothetical protein